MDRLQGRVNTLEALLELNEKMFVSMDTRLDNVEVQGLDTRLDNVEAQCEGLKRRERYMDARVGGLEDYLGMPVNGVQRVVLFDGLDFNNIENLRGPKHQKRNKRVEAGIKDCAMQNEHVGDEAGTSGQTQQSEEEAAVPSAPTPVLPVSRPAPSGATSAPASSGVTSAPAPSGAIISAAAEGQQPPQVVVIPPTPQSSQQEIVVGSNQVNRLSPIPQSPTPCPQVPQPSPPPVSSRTSLTPHAPPPPPSTSSSAELPPESNVSADSGMPPPPPWSYIEGSTLPNNPANCSSALAPSNSHLAVVETQLARSTSPRPRSRSRQPSPSSLRRSPRLNTPVPEESGEQMDIVK